MHAHHDPRPRTVRYRGGAIVLILAIAALASLLAGAEAPFDEPSLARTPADRSAAGSGDCNTNGIPDDVETDVSFQEQVVTAAAGGVRKVAFADIDGDGDNDALSVSANDGKVAWYENTDGAGSFGPQRLITSGLPGARSIAVADPDGDGDVDVFAGAPNVVGWYENTDGNGTFGPLQVVLATPLNPTSLVAADIDGDGDDDLAVADFDGDAVGWIENLGGLGNFGAIDFFASGIDGATTLASADLDGDGDVDLAVASRFDNRIAWFENLDGQGQFSAPLDVYDAAQGPSTVVASDIDLDGDLDLVAAHEVGDEVAWYENLDGAGSFGPPQAVTTSRDGPRSAAVADLDGDGDPDVAVASYFDDLITWYENLDGLGTFGPAQVATFFANGANWVVGGDLDGDGDRDLLASVELENEVVWFENESDDCNGNSIPDSCDLDSGVLHDCNANGTPDACEVGGDLVQDCNLNGSPDACDIAEGTSLDCTLNGVPDECEPDCNGNGEADSCDVDAGTSPDCNGNGQPDECEGDCNSNGVPDDCDIASGTPDDCANGIPDECEPDCNGNGTPDVCDISSGTELDCNENGVPDSCDLAVDGDCNGNSVPDECDIDAGVAEDCNDNLVPDVCDLAGGAPDCNGNGLLDECDTAVSFDEMVLSNDTAKPQWIVSDDLDGDGDLDLISVSLAGNPNPPTSIDWYENLDGAGTFSPRNPLFDILSAPTSVATGDLDSDGDPDLLVTHSCCSNQIVWYENLMDSGGGFGPFRPIADVTNGESGVIEDLDGDGDLDVAVTSIAENRILWWPNLAGTGTFGEVGVITTEVAWPNQIVTADLDGDGDLDVVSGSSSDDKVAWYANDGGTFGLQQIISTSGDSVRSVYAGDLDGDGDADVAAASFADDAVRWFRNDGQGGFSEQPVVSTTSDGAHFLTGGDFDGDGDLDLAVATHGDDRITWFENLDGLGGFGAGSTVAQGVIDGTCLHAADLDHDGDVDLAATSLFAEVLWFRNGSDDCDGNTVPDTCELPAGDCDANGILDACDVAVGSGTDCNDNGTLDACDLDGGTSLDCTMNGTPDECEPDCNGNLQADSCDIDAGTSPDCDANGIPDECQADCNGNGQSDLCDIDTEFSADCNGNFVPDECDIAAGTSSDECANGVPDECELDCNGNGQRDYCDIASGVSLDCDANAVPDECDLAVTFDGQTIDSEALSARSVRPADIDGDGDPDIVAALGLEDQIAWYENLDGEGRFGARNVISTLVSIPTEVTAADIDGDGDQDVLSTSVLDDKVAWYENLDGLGTFGAQQVLPSFADDPVTVDAEDLDGDGDVDVVTSYSEPAVGTIGWHENLDGLGTFGVGQVMSTQALRVKDIDVADLDRDGDLDVISAEWLDDAIMWFENDGQGNFSSEQFVGLTGFPTAVAAVDIDGDKDTDVVSGDANGQIRLYRNVDNSFVSGVTLYNDGADVDRIVGRDLDGDGDMDLAMVSATTDEVRWFEQSAGEVFTPHVVYSSAVLTTALAAGDVDSDGVADLVCADASGQELFWLRNGKDDCTSDGILDACEPDCNANGRADSCDLLVGSSIDCDANDVPDECDTACPTCDADGDACLDDLDAAPGDPQACADVDGDGCDDCALGQFDPAADGSDGDLDGFCDANDCDPHDGALWTTPSAVTTLSLEGPLFTTLTWDEPEVVGAIAVSYDTIRSGLASDFVGSGQCLVSDDAATTSVDLAAPDSGQVFYYLIRVENRCPGTSGAVLPDSNGDPRDVLGCP